MQHTHYYGDRVRSLLIIGATVMIVSIPFFTDLIPKPIFFSILAALLLILLSGLISPRQRFVVALSLFVSAGAFIAFESYAVSASQTLSLRSPFFIVNQLLALIFLFAAYFGTKSTRWLSQRDE